MNDDDFKQRLDNGWANTINHYDESVEKINSFFDYRIIPRIREWDICLTVDEKGTKIFNEQRERIISLCSIPVLSVRTSKPKKMQKDLILQETVNKYAKHLQSKSVIIFDDSIKSSNTISNVLNSIQQINVRSVTVAVLFCNKDVLGELKDKYNKIEFILPTGCNGETYGRDVTPYLEYICKPKNDIPYIKINFSDIPDENTIKNFFKNYGYLVPDKCPELSYYNDRNKWNLKLNDIKFNAELNIYSRINWRYSLYIQPYVLECDYANEDDDILRDNKIYEIEKHILINVLVNEFILEYCLDENIKISSFKMLFKNVCV